MRLWRAVGLALAVALLAFLFPPLTGAHTANTHVKTQLSQDQCPGTERANVEIDRTVLGCFFEQPFGTYNVYWTDHDPLTLSHELGHVYDHTSLKQAYRDQFRALFGLALAWDQWFITDRGYDASPAEWFAEAYARCDRHYPAELLTAYGFAPTRTQHRAVCRLIWNADRDR